ncbi:29403_t:CDS:1, partial [Gigaspora margarita]
LRNEHESQTTTLLPSLEHDKVIRISEHILQSIPAVVKSKCPAPLDIYSSRKSFRTPMFRGKRPGSFAIIHSTSKIFPQEVYGT